MRLSDLLERLSEIYKNQGDMNVIKETECPDCDDKSRVYFEEHPVYSVEVINGLAHQSIILK